MRIKATTDYAIRAVLYLAVKGEQCSSREISEAMHIPRDLLVQIAIRLRQASILAAQSGKYGGYSLMKKPADITLYDVVSAMEDEPALPGQDSFCEVTKAPQSWSWEPIRCSKQGLKNPSPARPSSR
mgnify:CR=1 FL=1